MLKAIWTILKDYWERLLFRLVGFSCLIFGFIFLYEEKITYASAVFAIAFFSFIYSNLARFKRFKGLGFEAELWEDKQKEAADLIDRLKNVVTIYTREIIMNNVMRGRFSSGENWKARWALYDEFVNQLDELGQKIDFTDLKRKMDGIFIFDACTPLSSAVRQSLDNAKSKAREIISKEFGSPITDLDGYNKKTQMLNAITYPMEDMFHRSENENIAQDILDKARAADAALQRDFSISADLDQNVIQKLETLAKLHNQRPLRISDEMIALADREKS